MFTRSNRDLTARFGASSRNSASHYAVCAGATESRSLLRAIREALYGALAPASDSRWIAAGVAGIAAVTAIAAPRASLSDVPIVGELAVRGGDGSEGFVALGEQFDGAGASVSGAGDVNGDGIDDMLIGATEADPRQRFQAGVTYVVFGRNTAQGDDFPALLPLPSLLPDGGGDGSRGFVLGGVYDADNLGTSVSSAGDVNGDGVSDLIVGSPFADPDDRSSAGASYVVFGRTSQFPAALDLRDLTPAGGGDGSAGFVLKGVHEFDAAGYSVSDAGDVNGDGTDDLLIAAPSDLPASQGPGESYVVFGRTTDFQAVFQLASLFPALGGDGSSGFVLRGGIFDEGATGQSVSSAGDVNGDGIDDVLIGTLYTNGSRTSSPGTTYVVFGRTAAFPAVLDLRTLLNGDGSDGFVLTGVGERDFSGRSVSGAGDVNGDGIDDLVIGAPGSFIYGHPGHSYVVFGRTSGFPAIFALRTLLPGDGGDGSEGFALTGVDLYDYAGYSVSTAGDVNGDGIDDLFIGAPRADPSGVDLAGESYVVFGRATGFPATFPLARLFPAAGGDGREGFVLQGYSQYDSSGHSVSSVGDINGDDIDDLIIGAPEFLFDDGYDHTYVVFGQTTGFPAIFELSSLLPP